MKLGYEELQQEVKKPLTHFRGGGHVVESRDEVLVTISASSASQFLADPDKVRYLVRPCTGELRKRKPDEMVKPVNAKLVVNNKESAKEET